MTDEITREEFERLKARVRRLEQENDPNDGNHVGQNQNGLDRRDAAVVAELEHGETYTPLTITKLYKRHTDIRRDETAKQRAKQLQQRDFLKRDGRSYIYRG